jgi:hypothetical protein
MCLAILASTPCFATTDDDEDLAEPFHYAIVPSLGLHGAISQLAGNKYAISPGIAGGVGFRFSRDVYFFTPNVRLLAIFGLDKSPASMWTIGFVAGGHFKNAHLDLFAGLEEASFISYKVQATPLFKVGANFDVGFSDMQVVVDAFYGDFTQNVVLNATTTNQITYSYTGLEVSLQFPIEL